MEGRHILSSFHPLDGDPNILVVRDYLINEDLWLHKCVRRFHSCGCILLVIVDSGICKKKKKKKKKKKRKKEKEKKRKKKKKKKSLLYSIVSFFLGHVYRRDISLL